MIKSILCVCNGNVFRSQVLEALIRNTLQQRKIQDVRVESAGIRQETAGLPVSADAIVCLDQLGIDIRGRCSRWIGGLNLKEYDLIIVMDPQQQTDLLKMKGFHSDTEVVVANPPNGVPDTIGMDFANHQRCFEILLMEAERIVKTYFKKIRSSD